MLKFNGDGRFGILLFGDLHEYKDYKTSPCFKDMQKLMVASIDHYKPDLCVLLGDVYHSSICKENPEEFKQGVKDICAPIFERNIPVAYIMGNHEHDADCDEDIIRVCSEIEGLIMRPDGVDDKADFFEYVYDKDGKTPKACLWFLDSNNLYEDKEKSYYDYVHTDQIEWFEKNNNKSLPAYIFQHIPVPEEYELLRKAKWYEMPLAVRGYGSHKGTWYVGKKGTADYVGEGPCSPDINNGQFESWKKQGNVKAAFFGHDHLNDFSGYVDGIFLAQHKTAGFRCYTDGCRSCVRYVEIKEESPDKFTQELKRFKEFGLKCESLGPIMKRISDRQSIGLHHIFRTLGVIAGVLIISYIIKILLG